MGHLPYEKSVLKYEKEGKFGLIDFEGKEITKPIYEELSSVKYKEGEILAKKNGKCGVISHKGKELISFEYEDIEADRYYNGSYEKSGYIVKTEDDEGFKYGYIDYKWKKILKPEYSEITRIQEIEGDDIYLVVAKNGQAGLIKNKNEEIDFAYQSISYDKNTNLLVVKRSEKYGVLTLTGDTIVQTGYKDIKINGTYICAKGYEEDTYFNTKGEKVETGYTGMKEAGNVYITTNENNLYGLADKAGKAIVENTYLYIDYAFDNYFVAYKTGEGLGVIDENGNKMVDFEYDVLSKIGEKKLLKAVTMGRDGDVTIIYSKDLKRLATLKDMKIGIHEDYIEAYNKEQEILIDNNGEAKTAKDIFPDNKLFAIAKANKWGFENKNGEIVVDTKYDTVTEFNRYGFAGIKEGDKWGIVNSEGNIILEPTFKIGTGGTKPEFLGKYYKTYKENGEIYYTNEINTDEYYEDNL